MTISVKNEALIEKIKKLLAKGKDAGVTEAEALLYITKAHELLLANNLELAAIEREDVQVNIDETIIETPYGTIKWCQQLLLSISELFFCRFHLVSYNKITKKGSYKVVKDFVVTGREHNRSIVVSMYEYLTVTTRRLGLNYSKEATPRYYFEHGCGMRLAGRVREKIASVRSPVVSGALTKEANTLPALYSTELALVDDYQNQKRGGKPMSFHLARQSRPTSDYFSGRQAANNISLDTQVGGQQKSSYLLA